MSNPPGTSFAISSNTRLGLPWATNGAVSAKSAPCPTHTRSASASIKPPIHSSTMGCTSMTSTRARFIAVGRRFRATRVRTGGRIRKGVATIGSIPESSSPTQGAPKLSARSTTEAEPVPSADSSGRGGGFFKGAGGAGSSTLEARMVKLHVQCERRHRGFEEVMEPYQRYLADRNLCRGLASSGRGSASHLGAFEPLIVPRSNPTFRPRVKHASRLRLGTSANTRNLTPPAIL